MSIPHHSPPGCDANPRFWRSLMWIVSLTWLIALVKLGALAWLRGAP